MSLDRFFRLRENQTDVRTEILAGATTFVTLAYILFVNPNILKDAGMPVEATFAATCVASAFASLVMGIYANYPIAVAPGMGLNAFFTYTVVIGMRLPWQTALGAVFISGLVFFLLTVTHVRQWIVDGVPAVLRSAIGVGIGLFIAFIGLRNAGIIVRSDATLVTLSAMNAPGVLVSVTGLLVTAFLVARRVRGALLLGILTTTAIAMLAGVSPAPRGAASLVTLTNPFAALRATAFHLDILAALRVGLIPILFSFTFVDLFDNIGTLIGVSRKAGLLNDRGQLPRIGRALVADSLGTMFGALVGTSTVTSYIESAAGVSEGGRTGLTAVVVAALFIIGLVFAPLVGLIPVQATAPALILIGAMMMTEIAHIRFDDVTEAVPAFLTIIMMPLTYSIAQGLAFGFVSYTIIKLLAGRHADNNLVTYTLTLLFLLHFVVGAHQ
ncbi:MAG TPA: NCS2 family permease [Vicinamibacterales bacterium]|nr:NCS2 family permease [Vicinamibacterales bacterium]